jgi:hypothetical protein
VGFDIDDRLFVAWSKAFFAISLPGANTVS